MTMASLSASLLTRSGDDRPRRRGTHPARGSSVSRAGHPLSGAQSGTQPGAPAKQQPFAAMAPPHMVPAKNSPGKTVAGQTGMATSAAVKRQAKTLRLDPETDQKLRLTAARLGKTQQSIMEQGLKTLLNRL